MASRRRWTNCHSADLLSSIGHWGLPVEQTDLTAVTEQRDRALTRILSNSVAEAVVGQTTEAQELPAAGASAPSSSQGAQQTTHKRKRKSNSSAGSCPSKDQKSTPKTLETIASDEGKSLCCFQTNKQNLFYDLLLVIHCLVLMKGAFLWEDPDPDF